MAIETPNNEDDQLWLTYWVLYCLGGNRELIAAPVIASIPFYSAAKLVVAAWLVLPQYRGGIVLHENLVHPYFPAANDGTLGRQWSTNINADAQAYESAAACVKIHGAEAVEALMTSATTRIKQSK